MPRAFTIDIITINTVGIIGRLRTTKKKNVTEINSRIDPININTAGERATKKNIETNIYVMRKISLFLRTRSRKRKQRKREKKNIGGGNNMGKEK